VVEKKRCITASHLVQVFAPLSTNIWHEWSFLVEKRRNWARETESRTAASLYLWLTGRDPYRDNPFEKEAYGRAP
jgi:hypothetical protein